MLFFFFFFQAEDGIRDFHVTGVQTCALPIFRRVSPKTRRLRVPDHRAVSSRRSRRGQHFRQVVRHDGIHADAPDAHLGRSEERRVGKECRARWAREHERKRKREKEDENVLIVHLYVVFFFFFSSRRRHTRFSRDWSSDVCSSDLQACEPENAAAARTRSSSRLQQEVPSWPTFPASRTA